MRVLVATLLTLAAPAAWAADCIESADNRQLALTLGQAETAWKGADEGGFLLKMEEAWLMLPCLDEPATPPLSARLHRDAGLWLFASGDSQQAAVSFASAKRVDPALTLPSDLIPEGHPARTLFDGASAGTGTEPAPAAEGGSLLFDGSPGDRPADSATLAQLTRDAGGMAWSTYLRPGQELPDYALAPVVENAASVKPGGTRSMGLPLAIGAGGLALGGGALALVARGSQQTVLNEPPATQDELDRLSNTNRGASTGSAVLFGLAGATGVTAVVLW